MERTTLLGVRELRLRAEVAVRQGNDRAADRHLVEHGGDRSQTRREDPAVTALEGAERLLEGRPGRVAEASVLEGATGRVGGGERGWHVQRLVGLRRGPAR